MLAIYGQLVVLIIHVYTYMLLMFPWRSQITRAHHIVGGCKRVLHEVHARLIRSTGSAAATDVCVVVHLQLL